MGGGAARAVGRVCGVPLGSVGVALPDLICAGSLGAFSREKGFADPESGASEGVAEGGNAGAGLAGLGDSEDAGAFGVDIEPSDVDSSSSGALLLFCEEEVSGSSVEESGARFATSDVLFGSAILVEAEEGAGLSVHSGIGEAGAGTGAALGFVTIGTGGGTGLRGGSTSLDLLAAPTS